MTPEEFRRQQRRDAGLAFFGLACLFVTLIIIGVVLVTYVEGRL